MSEDLLKHASEYVGHLPADAATGQFEILCAEGLRPSSKLLEIGCGCLYAGALVMEYLESRHYCGIDPNEWLRDTAIEGMHYHDLVVEKQPRFLSRDDFDGSEFDEKFDFVFSHSVLSHTTKDQLRQYLHNTSVVLADGGKILSSFFLAESKKQWTAQNECCVIGVNGDPGTPNDQDSDDPSWVYPGRSYFTWKTIQAEASAAGLTATLKPEYTLIVQAHSVKHNGMYESGHCHDWVLLTKP